MDRTIDPGLQGRTGPETTTVGPAQPRVPATRARGVRIDAAGLGKTVRGGVSVLQDVSLTILPGELVAIVGGSGAGKTTLLEALAAVRPADAGRVLFDGVDVYRNLDLFRTVLGYVPQDDIIHAELPLERTLRYAAMLRLPATASPSEVEQRVAEALRALNLSDRAGVRVGALSGGQRKRASIAVELLTRPRVFFLDEPTSGLDPATDAELVRVLRGLAGDGATVVFTTHAVQDLHGCDRIVFLAAGGRLAFIGSLPEALGHFGVTEVEEIYERLATSATPDEWAERFRGREQPPLPPTPEPGHGSPAPAAAAPVGGLRQWTVLTRRTFETLVRNRLTLAILLGSPAMVVAMFAILFRPGAFDFAHPSPSAVAMILFWIAFGAFFFGLTYGLLQICVERPILRREHLVGLRLGAYLLSKVAVLLPFLLVVDVLMLAVLRALDRLPAASLGTYLSLGVTLALDAAAALTLGLLTSAAVGNPSQATLALPLLCFPAVLFSGAILPVHLMAGVGAAISAVIPVRWAWEAIGHDLGVRNILAHGHSALGPPLLHSYGGAGTHATGTYWVYLAVFTVVFLAGAWVVLIRTCRRNVR
ncbi:MAG: ATP-binding cassette domain-containing protein [Actinomycetota bacterium]|nr:ATP-binding cassette domain-containing protein [Actinomycetota bacterium]